MNRKPRKPYWYEAAPVSGGTHLLSGDFNLVRACDHGHTKTHGNNPRCTEHGPFHVITRTAMLRDAVVAYQSFDTYEAARDYADTRSWVL
jgi:hypothetical protein